MPFKLLPGDPLAHPGVL